MLIITFADFYRALIHGPYAWPGGYPVYWIMADGEACAFNVGFEEAGAMLQALSDYQRSGLYSCNNEWRPAALEVNWEDPALYCAHTGARIESAYAEEN